MCFLDSIRDYCPNNANTSLNRIGENWKAKIQIFDSYKSAKIEKFNQNICNTNFYSYPAILKYVLDHSIDSTHSKIHFSPGFISIHHFKYLKVSAS